MATASSPSLAALRERYVEHLVAGDAADAQAVVAEALRTMPLDVVYDALLAEALHEVGRRWAAGEVSIAQEHLATGICTVALPDLAMRLPRTARRRRAAAVACAPSEQHAVGSRIVADYLEAAGWDVLHLGAVTPAGSLLELVVARNVEVVALSAAMAAGAAELVEVCMRLGSLPRPPLVAVGGQAYADGGAPPLAADLTPRSPAELVAQLDARYAA